MKKFFKFCIVAVLVVIGMGLLMPYVMRFRDEANGTHDFWVKITGGKNLLESIKEGGDALLDGVLERYESLEGFDINDATIFDKDEMIESGNIERTFEQINASVLHVEIGGCALEILNSEDGSARVVAENVGKFQAYQKGDEFRIASTRKAKENAEDSRITLYLPAGYSWQAIDLEVGAGQILTEGLKAGELDISVGAGEIRLRGMEVSSLGVKVGAGNFVAQGNVTGSIEAECAMGNLELQLAGSRTDYNYELECVAGNIKIGEEQYGGGVVKEQNINNGAGRRMDLECSMGNITVTFGGL
ncbi:MAG: DUF4097 family beta strand repeat protein [Lachnospiraceae bacterium]|nr:DUF4097 family beta strand repeat protein [Lachnospiraceae bacterium]